jgi:hypothetical protein
LNLETVYQEIYQLKGKINLYKDDLQAAKTADDKEGVKVLTNLLISKENLLIELQKEKNLLIANKGKNHVVFYGYFFPYFITPLFSLFNTHTHITKLLSFVF